MLAEHGAYVVDADAIAREVVAPRTVGLAELAAQFGPDILDGDGSLDRAALAGIVFADPSQRAKLDAITHPLIAALTQERYRQAGPGQIIVHDVPLLAELGLASHYDHVVVVDCPDDVRVTRLVERGLTETDARARIGAQATREGRLAIADSVLDNSTTQQSLVQQVDDLWGRLVAQADEANSN